MQILQKYLELAVRAHNGTSFSPEKRGASVVKDYSEQLAEDLEKVTAQGGDANAYQEKYERLFTSWLRAKSGCLSSMITGPSGFPTRRAEKANRSEHNRYKEFQDWREGYFARVEKNARRAARAASDPLAETRESLAKAERAQEAMKAANKIIQNKKTSEAEKVTLLMELLKVSEAKAVGLMQPDFCGRIGFAAYQLTNNNANIKRMRERVEVLERKAAAETKEVERADGVRLVENRETDRLQIFFPEKPDAAMVATLKKNAFKWAPSVPCWQRQLTDNARRAVWQMFPTAAV